MGKPSRPHPSSLKGKLLLAAPTMEDSLFERSVIIITAHTLSKGAKGLILNKPMERSIAELTGEAPDIPAELSGVEVFHGGPVEQDELNICAFTSRNKRLFYRTKIERLEALSLIQTPGSLIRCFAGHSAWEAGQLEQELVEGTWIILPSLATLLGMAHDSSLWQLLLEHASPLHALLSRAPKHSFFN